MVQIAIDHVTKRFPSPAGKTATVAVNDVSLTVPSGHLYFLLGPSGCGKTTLLRMIAGFILPDAGRILFDGRDMSFVPPHQRDTGMVFQSYALWPHMTVADNVGFGLDLRKVKNPDRAKRIEQALALVQMAHLPDRRPAQLSGGQQQRVALARALAVRPQCLLLDEPLSNLDAKLRLEMRTEIRRIVKQTGITALYVTHDQKEALSMADGIAVLRAGKLEQAGTPTELYRRPASRFVANFIGEANFLDGTVESVSSAVVVVATPAGPVLAARPALGAGGEAAWKPAQRVTAAFRPEAVQLAGARAGANATRLPAKRVAATYLGDAFEYLLELPGGSRVKAYDPNPRGAQPPAEEEVTATLAAEDVILLPPGD